MSWDPFTKPKMVAAPGRVVRNLSDDGDDEPETNDEPTRPRIPALLEPDAEGNLRCTRLRKKEPKMPKGVYDRKARTEKADDAPPEPKKRGRKRRAVAVVPEVAVPRVNGSKGRFDVALDLRAGAVTINATAGSLTLAPDEVLALFAFLGRR